MSRPRRPFGNPPGRLPATMIRVLAAEMSDSGRLARGKRYWADHAVVDIVVGHGAVTAEIQGSRAQPYVVTIEASPGAGVPAKREVWIRCTCPDDSGYGKEACKHAVAAMFALSDEIAVEPELLDRWRGGTAAAHRDHHHDQHDDAADDEDDDDDVDDDDGSAPVARPLPSNVVPLHRDRGEWGDRVFQRQAPAEPDERDTTADELAALLAPPGAARAPVFPELEPLRHPPLRDRLVSDVLADALDGLGIDLD